MYYVDRNIIYDVSFILHVLLCILCLHYKVSYVLLCILCLHYKVSYVLLCILCLHYKVSYVLLCILCLHYKVSYVLLCILCLHYKVSYVLLCILCLHYKVSYVLQEIGPHWRRQSNKETKEKRKQTTLALPKTKPHSLTRNGEKRLGVCTVLDRATYHVRYTLYCLAFQLYTPSYLLYKS